MWENMYYAILQIKYLIENIYFILFFKFPKWEHLEFLLFALDS